MKLSALLMVGFLSSGVLAGRCQDSVYVQGCPRLSSSQLSHLETLRAYASLMSSRSDVMWPASHFNREVLWQNAGASSQPVPITTTIHIVENRPSAMMNGGTLTGRMGGSNYVNSHDYYYSSNYYQIPSVYPWSSPTPITFPIKGSNSPNTQTQTLTNSPVSTTSPPLTLPPTSIQPQTIPVSNEGASVASYFPELGPAIPINTTSSLPQIQPQVIQTYVTPSQTIPIQQQLQQQVSSLSNSTIPSVSVSQSVPQTLPLNSQSNTHSSIPIQPTQTQTIQTISIPAPTPINLETMYAPASPALIVPQNAPFPTTGTTTATVRQFFSPPLHSSRYTTKTTQKTSQSSSPNGFNGLNYGKFFNTEELAILGCDKDGNCP